MKIIRAERVRLGDEMPDIHGDPRRVERITTQIGKVENNPILVFTCTGDFRRYASPHCPVSIF